MTKFIDKTKEQKEIKNKTEFLYYISEWEEIGEAAYNPDEFDFVELIRRKEGGYEFDFFVAYDKNSPYRYWYLGKAGDEFR